MTRGIGRSLGTVVLVALCACVAADIVLALLPPHYSILTDSESDYAIGPFAWLMDATFVLVGLVSLALAAGLVGAAPAPKPVRRWIGSALIALWGVGLLVLALFPTSLQGAPLTASARVHLVVAPLAFAAVAAGESVLTPDIGRVRDWQNGRRLLVGITGAMWLGFLLTWVTFAELGRRHGLGQFYGLAERLFLLSVLGWMATVASAMRRAPQDPGAGFPDEVRSGPPPPTRPARWS